MSKLLIVESPTKARTISKFLGREYKVLSSFGHIRDLPKKEMGVDVAKGFLPSYVVPDDKKKQVSELKKAAKASTEIYLATDEDREGEAIAWHIANVLGLDPKTAKRITFHEITKSAIEEALKEARTLSMDLVDAQQTRRILDRLVGYELSPFLWKKVQRGLSAGRVQSVSVRLIVERERERDAFKKDEYWTIDAEFQKDELAFPGKLAAIGEKKLKKLDIKNEEEASAIVKDLQDATYQVKNSEKKQTSKKPPTPFKTSTLQQEANNKLGFSAKQTMTLAQKLYETGRITYMRTDSLNLADQFLQATQSFVKQEFGDAYAKGVVTYKTSKKGAQEAHEAIRPTDVLVTPDSLQGEVDRNVWRLYDLIWSRTVASQMPAAKIDRTAVDIEAKKYIFRATGSTIAFDGFMRVYRSAQEKILPTLEVGDAVEKTALEAKQHFTEPPARYSDASLVKTLEEYEIGRPSTYAPTLNTIVDRGYIERDEQKKLFPTDIAYIVTDLLVEHFSSIVDYEFTANMERSLDEIAEGKIEWQPMLEAFYVPFHKNLEEKSKNLTREDVMKPRDLGPDPETGKMIIVKHGRFGPYVQLGEWDGKDKENKPKMASIPKDMKPDDVTIADAVKALSLPREVGKTENDEVITAQIGPYGPYLKAGKQNVSIPEDKDVFTITEADARDIIKNAEIEKKKMQEPLAKLGPHPESKKEMLVKNGRFGPYVTDGTINASIPKKYDPLTLTAEEATELITKKKARGGGKGRAKKRRA